MKIWTVDAFTKKPYHGNPAGVVIVDEFPADNDCQRMAAEINLSETAFVKCLQTDVFHIRWFTPKVEVKLCGHATLAASHILFQEGRIQGDMITFNSLSGELLVYKNDSGITLDFPLQKTGPEIEKNVFEEILLLDVVAVQQAYDDIIVELRHEDMVRQLDVDIEKIKSIDCRGVIVTAAADKAYDFISRFFAPRVGVDEDPVTGSAHCKLAEYWQKKLGKNTLRAYQASQRGGELLLVVHDNRVHITGNAVTVMHAEWLV